MKTLSLVLRTVAVASLGLAPLLAACGDDTGATDAAPPDMARRIVDLSGTRSGIGNACQPNTKGTPRGTCVGDEAICVTDGQLGLDGGYCVQDCVKTGCPSDSDCVELAPGFDLCMALCNTDADCRAADGYVCSDYNVCVPGLGFYLGSAVRPGTNAGDACDAEPQTASMDWAPNQQLSVLNGTQVSLAVDEVGGASVVAWQNMYGTQTIMVASSQDGGNTFNPPIALPPDNLVDNNDTQSNPSVAVDQNTGIFYVAWTGSGTDPDNVYVARSTDQGLSFPDVFVASPPGESSLDTLDHPSIAVGPDSTVYVAWTTTTTGARVVRLVVSKDGGATWSAPIDVTPDDTTDHENARVAVSADLSIWIAYVELSGDANGDVANKVAVQKLLPDAIAGAIVSGAPVVLSGAEDSPTLDVPGLAVDGPHVYVAFSSGSPRGQWDIKAGYTLDGLNAKPSIKVNSDATCATHFHPSVAVDGNGTVHFAYVDNRNLDGGVRHATAAVAAGVLAVSSEEVVNDMPFPFTTEAFGFDWLGDYIGLAAGSDNVYLGWADTRLNDTAQVLFSQKPLQ
jgi:hypothetical protein